MRTQREKQQGHSKYTAAQKQKQKTKKSLKITTIEAITNLKSILLCLNV